MPEGHTFDATILREYDVRGVVGSTLSTDDAYHLGRAFATTALRRGGRALAVGYDGRLSSPDLEQALVAGLRESGCDVVRVGRGPTPMLYYAAAALDVDGGLMITGSHNPPDYNGFKMTLLGSSFFGADIVELGRIAAEGDYESGSGAVTDQSAFDAYVERLLEDAEAIAPLSVAWDAGNGAAGEAMRAVASRLPGTHILLNEEIDGTFPAHHPDPTVPENLEQLRDVILSEGCDLGIAFDGDGDRIGAMDAQGRILWGDQIMLYLARDVLADHPGATIIADVKASQALFDGIKAAGGEPVMWKTGHSLIKSKMAELKAPFAGEMSAHLFFADRYYGYDDALYAAVRLLSAISRTKESLEAFRDSLPALLNTPEIRFPCSEDRKWQVVSEVQKRLRDRGAEVCDIDGVRVTTDDGWWLLRASNTQDVLVARCEATDEAGLERLKAGLSAELSASGLSPPPF